MRDRWTNSGSTLDKRGQAASRKLLQPPPSLVPLQGDGVWVPGDTPVPAASSARTHPRNSFRIGPSPPNDTFSISTSER